MDSSISSLDWSRQPWPQTGLGEVWNAPRVYDRRPAPAIFLPDHICGEKKWFQEGQPLDPDPPFTAYDADGIPTCCRPALTGVLIGGSAPAIGTGGAVLLGGEALVGVFPSTTCLGAPTLALGTTYTYSTDPAAASEQWVRFAVTPGLHTWIPSGFGPWAVVVLSEGANCASLTPFLVNAKINQFLNAVANDFIYVQIINVTGGIHTYSFSLS